MIGSASINPLRNTSPAARVSARNALLLTGFSPIGNVWKVSTSMEMSHRWPLNDRKSSIASISIMRASTGMLRWLPGSTNVANDSPICRPISSPAVRTAAKASCMVKPTATPIRICCNATHTALAEKIGIFTGGREGATMMVMMMPSPTLTRFGIAFSLRIGAVVISARMRSMGQK